VSDLLLQRLVSVGKSLAFCGERDGGSMERLFVFAERPSEAAIAQKIGFNRDRERMIFGHGGNMGRWRSVFQHAIWLSISK
jgi:hypothetical protein